MCTQNPHQQLDYTDNTVAVRPLWWPYWIQTRSKLHETLSIEFLDLENIGFDTKFVVLASQHQPQQAFLPRAAMLAAILNFSNCSRVRTPHPPGYVNLDPLDTESAEKKTISHEAGFSPRASRLIWGIYARPAL